MYCSGIRHDGVSLGSNSKKQAIVSRDRILDSAIALLELYTTEDSFLTVQFSGEVGHGAGPTKEFYTLVCKEFQRRELGILREDNDHRSANTSYHEYVVSKRVSSV